MFNLIRLQNYLLVLLVLVVVVVFVLVVLPVVVELLVELLTVVLPPLFDGLLIGDIAGLDAGDAVFAGLVVFALLVAVLVFDSPGQAAPNKPNVKTAERAITFFIRLYSPVFFKESIFTYCLTTVLRQSSS